MPVFLIPDEELTFPHPSEADAEGLLGIGGDLRAERLLLAYRYGIFPWYNASDPILWWSPDPRLVLFPAELHIAKSIHAYFNQNKYRVTFNHHFREVMEHCRSINRPGQDGTWINQAIVKAYGELHARGHAHSVEVWEGSQLCGGLYGVQIGRVFYGESMFSLRPNASRFGFITLVRLLHQWNFTAIDCQQDTPYLRSFGARLITRQTFLKLLQGNTEEFHPVWPG